MSNLINVGLYGAGSRNSRLRAEYIYCDSANECSAYKEGKCFCVTTLFGVSCGIGKVDRIDGGTKQSKRFQKVRMEAKENPCYAKLSYPAKTHITKIGDKAFLANMPVRIEEKNNGKLICSDPGFGSNKIMISQEILTPENIMAICSARPYALIGGLIESYKKETVPMFLYQLSFVFPDKYKEFIEAYPDFDISHPNWIGRYAKLITCNREEKYKDTNGNEFFFDGEYLVCKNYKSAFNPFRSKFVEIRIKVTDDMEVEITDNKQVLDSTVFV